MTSNKIQKPLLSVVIPTRNRFMYVKSAIISILALKDLRIELVIQDNSNSSELMSWIEENFADTRLKYNYSKSPLSFVGNFNEGVKLATGEYLCIIGDDDGINPEIIDVTAWLKQENIDCLTTKISANFVWGDAEVPTTYFTKVTGGVLTMSKISGKIIESQIENELAAFVKGGAINYLDFKLPKIYHGIVSAKCLEEVKSKTGAYFGGLSPDIFASITLACIVKRVFFTDYPLTISGVCGVSASIVEGLLKKNSKKIEDAPHLRNRGEYEWSDLVPKVYCVETIWADSAISALKTMGRTDLIEAIDIPKFSANCVHSNQGITTQILYSLHKVSKLRGNSYIKLYVQYIWNLLLLKFNYIFDFFNRIHNRILITIGKKQFYNIYGLENINEATVALNKYLFERNISFKNIANKINENS